MKSTKARLATAALLALGLLALFAGPASAMKLSLKITHPAGGSTGTMFLEGGVATDSAGNVYVRDTQSPNIVIEKYNSSGVFQSSFKVPTSAGLVKDIEVDPAGNIWTVSSGTLSKFSSAGILLKQVAMFEESFAVATNPSGVTYVLTASAIWGYNANAEAVSGYLVGDGSTPSDLDIDSAGNGWVALPVTNKVQRITSSNVLTSFTAFASALSADNSGNVWASVPGTLEGHVRKYSATGTLLESFGGTALANMKSRVPNVAAGPAGAVWVTTQSTLQKWVP